MRKKHTRKIIVSIIIVAILIILCSAGVIITAMSKLGFLKKILICAPILCIAVAVIFELKARISEIEGGEEDDLSNY